jgi:uncharacterized membrane protein YfcA
MTEFVLPDLMSLTTLFVVSMCFFAGFIDSIAGGGGLLILPALLVTGFPAQAALGTAKFTGTFGTAVAVFNFIKARMIIWKVIVHGIFFSLIGAYFGSNSILSIKEEEVAKIVILLLPIAIVAVFIPKGKIHKISHEWSKLTLYLWIPIVCFAIGFYDGFFGPGTGSFLILALHLFFGLSLSSASATAKIFNLSSNIGAVITFMVAGKLFIKIAIPMAIACMLGNYVGSKLTMKKGDGLVRYTLIFSVAILMITLIYKFAFY